MSSAKITDIIHFLNLLKELGRKVLCGKEPCKVSAKTMYFGRKFFAVNWKINSSV